MTQKKCNKCSEIKPIGGFSPNGKYGHHPVCKVCRSELAKQYRLSNPAKVKSIEQAQYRKHYAKKRAAQALYHERNKEKRALQHKAKYQDKAALIKAQAALYRQSNKAKIYEWNGTRRAALREAVPTWANRVEIASIYKQARDLSGQFVIKYHVDHIIPLSHELVCGLHIPINLQIIQATDNLTKSNKFDCSKY